MAHDVVVCARELLRESTWRERLESSEDLLIFDISPYKLEGKHRITRQIVYFYLLLIVYWSACQVLNRQRRYKGLSTLDRLLER